MKTRYFAAAFLFVLLLSGQSLQPNHASANCCGCSCMPWMCTCSGKVDPVQGYCPYCLAPDHVLKVKTSIDNGADHGSTLDGLGLLTFGKPHMIQRVMYLRLGQPCFREKAALSLLGDIQSTLNVQLDRFDEKNADRTLALEVETSKE